jgi:tetratricopeptide (TPR) repeat protein
MRRGLALPILLASAVALAAGDLPAHRPSPHVEAGVVNPLLTQARKALFEDSQLDRARQRAQEELRQNPGDVEGLFVEMEAAALEVDTTAELNAALKLCESRATMQRDPRVNIAAARVLDLAANTQDFVAATPRIQAMLAPGVRRGQAHPQASYLRAALVVAAADGAPGINLEKMAREAGLMTEWRVAGPFGNYPNLEFDQHWSPERDSLRPAVSEGHAVERLHFDDGMFRLPSYFSRSGVFYAAADANVTAARELVVRVESAGTLEVLIDGAVVVRKDDRFRVSPEIAWRTVELRPGAHRVLVKFLASAAPFRVALVPAMADAPPKARATAPDYAPESTYIALAQKYWAGDYGGVITSLGAKPPGTAAVNFLLFQAWAHLAGDSPEIAAMLNATLEAAPEALAAEYAKAARAFSADRTDEALSRLRRVLSARENFAPAQQLLTEIAISLNWPALSEKALEIQLRVHPSCDVLLQGYKFFAGHARYERAQELQRRLADCAPDSLAYERSLSDSGEHAQAAAAIEAAVKRRPLDRSARELLVHELAMADEPEKARVAAQELATLAPNSARYRRMAQIATTNVDALLDENGARSRELAGEPFYAKYRRDGVQMVRKTNERKFSGGPALVLLNDRVVRLWEDGSVSLYVHKLTRMLGRDGIDQYGEAAVPAGAEILELRTVKANGSVAEPELTPQKTTVSMPALAVGDSIEEEYVVHYRDGGGIEAHGEAFRHTFGSFAAPILYSRFVTITPPTDAVLRAEASPGILPPRIEITGNTRVRVWEKNDIPQSVEEAATARGDVIASAGLQLAAGWDGIRDKFRNGLVDALRVGPRVAQRAVQVRAQEPQAKAHEIFRTVTSLIHAGGGFNPEDMKPAEETLASGSGCRTFVVLAIARAAGLEADLVLARNAGQVVRDRSVFPEFYNRPLLRFHFADGREIFADAETDGLAFGAIPPSIERHDALLVPVLREPIPLQVAAIAPAMVPLPANAEEQSVADADVTLESDGSLRADVTIRMGPWRAAQMRSILAGIAPQQRARFYQQLATRIFPGVDEVTASARNEHDPDRKLELALRCRAPRYVNPGQSTMEIDQLVPALGLKKMYGGAPRKYPLYIDTPLVESANFRVHLPTGMTVVRDTPELNVSGAFGRYSLVVRQPSPEVLYIQRSFSIPVQVVGPERYAEFSSFASKIEEVERQRITLQKN